MQHPTTFRKPRAERWQQVLDVAAEVFSEKSYDAASLQEIADRVGIKKGSLFNYIQTKAALRDHLVREVYLKEFMLFSQWARDGGGAIERLAAMVRGHLEDFAEDGPRMAVYLNEVRRLDPAARKQLFGNRTFPDLFAEVIAQGQAEGVIRPELDAELASRAILILVRSVHQWSLAPPREAAGQLVQTILRGHSTPQGVGILAAMDLT